MNKLFSSRTFSSHADEHFSNAFENNFRRVTSELTNLKIENLSEKWAEKGQMSKLVFDREKIDLVGVYRRHTRKSGGVFKNVAEYDVAIYKIPVKSNLDLLNVAPSKLPSRYTVPGDISRVNHELRVEIDEDTLFNGNDELEKRIVKQFENYYQQLDAIADALNNDVDKYNASLKDRFKRQLIKKKTEAENAAATRNNLKPFSDK